MAEDGEEIVGFVYECVGIIDDDAQVPCEVEHCTNKAATIWQCTSHGAPHDEKFCLCHVCWQFKFCPTREDFAQEARRRRAASAAAQRAQRNPQDAANDKSKSGAAQRQIGKSR